MSKTTLNSYLNLCTQVYDLSKPTPPEDAYTFYRTYVMNAQGPILEPMCGTGRFLLPLCEEGFDIQGFDASEHMLAALYAKAEPQDIKPNVWKGFIEDLNRPERYSLIFIPSGSFGLITDLTEASRTLKILYEHLTQNGILLFEAETLKSVPNPLGVWRASSWHKADGSIIIASFLAKLEDHICHSIGKYELSESNKIVSTEIEEMQVRLYEPEDLIEILKAVGFNDIRKIKAFNTSSTADKDDEVIVYECKK